MLDLHLPAKVQAPHLKRQNSQAPAISFNRTTNTAGNKYSRFEAHYPFITSEIEAANFKANASREQLFRV